MSKYLLKEHFHEFLLVFSEEIDVNFIGLISFELSPNLFRKESKENWESIHQE